MRRGTVAERGETAAPRPPPAPPSPARPPAPRTRARAVQRSVD